MGDFIDRGPQGVEVVQAVRAMVDGGSALAVMGNHELNAIAWHMPDERDPGEYLRPHRREPWGSNNRAQHAAFLAQVKSKPAEHAALIEFFLTLSLWLDLPGLRVVHACWHGFYIDWLAPPLNEGRLSRDLLESATTSPANLQEVDTATPSIFKAGEALTKGLEIGLPASHRFVDKDGIGRGRVRIRWWDHGAATYRDIALLPEADRLTLPEVPLPTYARLADGDARPVFFGQYWMTGEPRLQSETAVCVDSAQAKVARLRRIGGRRVHLSTRSIS